MSSEQLHVCSSQSVILVSTINYQLSTINYQLSTTTEPLMKHPYINY